MKRAVGASATALAARSARPRRLIPHPASNPKPSHSVSRSTRPVSHSETKVRRSIRGDASSIQNVSRSIHSVSDSGHSERHSGNKVSDSSGKFRVASCSLSHLWKNCSERGRHQPQRGCNIQPRVGESASLPWDRAWEFMNSEGVPSIATRGDQCDATPSELLGIRMTVDPG